jgi:hypothetical protein
LAWDITGTGIKKYSTNKGNLRIMVWYQQQYYYWKITIIKLQTAILSLTENGSYQTITHHKHIMNYLPQSLFCHLALSLLQEEVQEEVQILYDINQLQWIESHAIRQVQVTSPLPRA